MREIKFRGQRVNNKKWVYGFVVKHSYLEKYFIYEMLDNTGALVSEVIPETVGQYTGLKDKNGVEIYEGDILECYDDSALDPKWGLDKAHNGIVVYNCNYFSLKCDNVFLDKWVNAENIKVIGNIYQKSELLK